MIGDPTPASSNSGGFRSSGDGQARGKERLVVDLDQDRVLPGLLEAQVADLRDQVESSQARSWGF
jgi:hypothetical protein